MGCCGFEGSFGFKGCPCIDCDCITWFTSTSTPTSTTPTLTLTERAAGVFFLAFKPQTSLVGISIAKISWLLQLCPEFVFVVRGCLLSWSFLVLEPNPSCFQLVAMMVATTVFLDHSSNETPSESTASET